MASPDPAYIAASAASQIVTNDQDARSDAWFDQNGFEPSGETALVAPGALKLVNGFLDQLLLNFLSIARSASLASLRPAVIDVLKPKLAKSAIHNADAELQEYLGGGEDEELALQNGTESSGDLDLELLWKRTRLRCMVYSSLGDMEEDEEDHWTEQDQLDGLSEFNGHRFSGDQNVVSPAVAIFLTCILEFMGEQALIISGQAAYQRLRAKHDKEIRDGVNSSNLVADRMVVEEQDMERVALDRTLGRLWRGWKKRIRPSTTGGSISRSFSRESLLSRGQSRKGSFGNESHVPINNHVNRKSEKPERDIPNNECELPAHERAAAIPLPMNDNDIREIEIPGLSLRSDEDSETDTYPRKWRPRSLVILRDLRVPPTPNTSEPNTPLLSPTSRKRSHSLPSPATTVSLSPMKNYKGSQVDSENVCPAAPVASVRTVESKVGGVTGLLDNEMRESNNAESVATISVIPVGSVVALGAATAVDGRASRMDGSHADVTDIEDLEDEEPQVMTSSRISLDQISLDRTVPHERPATGSSSVRSRSVHSVKLVDVTSPRSPSRSNHGSVASFDRSTFGGSLSSSPSNSSHSLNNAGANILYGNSPVQRGTSKSPVLAKATRNSMRDSISEYGEVEAEAIDSSSERSIPSGVAVPERSPFREVVPASSKDPEFEKPTMSANTPLFGELEPAFVLDDAPVTRSHRSITQPPRSVQHISVTSHLNTKAPESGVPPLTPLREMMEVAPDTSDEASSVAPSDGQSDTYGLPSVVPSLAGSQNYRSPDGKRSLETPRVTPRSLNFRISAPQGREEDVPQRSERSQRPQTSGSSTSSKSHKLRRIRTSEDSMPNGGDDKSKSFEQLLNNDQTLQYTLTPQNMREIESPDSPRLAHLSSLSDANDTPRPPTGQSASKLTSVNSPLTPRSAPAPILKPAIAPPVVTAQRQVANTASKLRPSVSQARDARVERNSMGDFADFIRSTGPPGVTLSQSPRSAHTEARQRNQNSTVYNTSPSRYESAPPSAPPSRRSNSSTGRVKLQARDAIVPRRDNTSDLIDFIRQGPPNANPHENPRIPRSVAPFRTTMDSDQMSGAIASRSADLSPTEGHFSRVSNDQSMQSVNSSMNSQSALLNSHKSAAKNMAQGYDPHEGDMPKRKTRRVRDPFPIDLTDDEDEDDVKVSPEPRREQESIVEFLKTVPPPPTSSVFDDVPKPVDKKSSHSTLMSRFSRGSPPRPSKSSASNRSLTRPKNDAPQIPPLHTPMTLKSKYSAGDELSSIYRAAPTNYVSRIDKQRKPVITSSGRVQQKAFEPRGATNPPLSRGTVELADFLMNTPPPAGNGPQKLAFGSSRVSEKENIPSNGGFSRMFVRRKKLPV